jgi:hypothetical protein
MAMPFSRSLRSLADDHPRQLIRAVVGVAVFLILWILWLLLAQLPVYKTSDSVRVEERERQLYAVADFAPAQALGHIQAGQQGWLQVDGFSALQYGKIPVTVTSISAPATDQPVRVELALGAEGAIPLQAGMPGRVEIVIARTTPARLLLRTVGGMVGDGAEE